MTHKNIYGEEIELKGAQVFRKGYAAAPGTGPAGETCGTCLHHEKKQMGNTYHKCGLMKAIWTGGAATDIKVRSPACEKWESKVVRGL